MSKKVTRRSFLNTCGSGLLASQLGLSLLSHPNRVHAQSMPDPRFLIVVAGAGGGSIIDSVLAVRDSETTRTDVNPFPDMQVRPPELSTLRAAMVAGEVKGKADTREHKY